MGNESDTMPVNIQQIKDSVRSDERNRLERLLERKTVIGYTEINANTRCSGRVVFWSDILEVFDAVETEQHPS